MIIKPEGFKYEYGANLRKVSGSSWQGKVVGFYSNKQTPEGYAIESEREIGSVQIYPVKALERVSGDPDGDQHFLFLMENIMTSPVKESQPHEDKKFTNYYHCDSCKTSCTDDWDCQCDDRCPKCSITYTPYKSEEIK